MMSFLTSAGAILASGALVVQDAINLVNLIKSVIDAKADPTDAQWEALHAYEARMTAQLDAKMDGES